MDDFGLLVGRHFTSLPSLSDDHLSELQLDSSGRLIIAGRFIAASDSYTANDSGLSMLAVRNDSDAVLTGVADGEYTPLQVDENGRLKVVADLEVANGHEKAEDSAHATSDIGSYVLAVRVDDLTADNSALLSGTNGDYQSFFVNDTGELYVKATDTDALLTTIDGVLDNIYTEQLDQGTTLDAIAVDVAAIETELLDQGTTLDSIETEVTSIDDTLTALSKAEDSVAGDGDQGIMALAVRRDADGANAADGDYAELQVDANGKLKVAADIAAPGSEQYTVTDALAGGGDGLETITAAATPWVTVASYAHTSGTAYIYGYQWACDQNAQVRLVTDVSGTVTYYKTDVNSSAVPGASEHFAGEGRIEIAGVANQEIRLQIKKRTSTGGNANGTGSIHIRTV